MQIHDILRKSPFIVVACVLVAMIVVSASSEAGSSTRQTMGAPELPAGVPDKHTGQDEVGGPGDGLQCPADTNGDHFVNVDDIVNVITNWGPCNGFPCNSDVNQTGVVDVDDLVDVLLGWGTCP